jgi:acetoin utilization deacetylase AcuC-like enzyme
MMKTGLVAEPFCKAHDTGLGHPERPERFDAVMDALEDAGLRKHLVRIESRDATREELLLCHTSDYLDGAESDIRGGATELSTGDTSVSESSWEVALRATGSVLSAVEGVMESRVQNAFCVVRPPGHHATRSRGMGFCIVNHVAIAARFAQRKYGIERVLIVDWDVHHGNGTQDIFYEDDSVLFFSTHQWPLYPGTGASDETGSGAGKGTTINCPLPAGTGGAAILEAFKKYLLPAADAFAPDLVLISAGFDSRVNDPLGGFRLQDEDFATLTELVLNIAARHASARVVSILEGGYNLRGLGTAAAAHVAALSKNISTARPG